MHVLGNAGGIATQYRRMWLMRRRLVLASCLVVALVLLRLADSAGRVWAYADAVLADAVRRDADVVEALPSGLLWEGLAPATCMPDHCFCERVREGAIRQPANTWSNLAFILVGVMTIVVAEYDLSRSGGRVTNLMRHQPIYPGVYGIATILIGVGSTLYHSSLAFFGQSIDVISMYLLTSFMLLYNLSRAGLLSSRSFAVSYLTVNALAACLAVSWPVLRRYLFLVLLVAVLASEVIIRRRRRSRIDRRLLHAALVSLVLACMAWVVDLVGVGCMPESWFQGHALWHILMAAVIGLVYFYYRSESRLVDLPQG